MAGNFYADVTNNVIGNVGTGVQVNNFSVPNPGGTGSISGNVVTAYDTGVLYNLSNDAATPIPVSGNQIAASPALIRRRSRRAIASVRQRRPTARCRAAAGFHTAPVR